MTSTRRCDGAAAAGVIPPGEVFARGDGIKRVFVTDPDGHVIELMQTGIEDHGRRASGALKRERMTATWCERRRANMDRTLDDVCLRRARDQRRDQLHRAMSRSDNLRAEWHAPRCTPTCGSSPPQLG